MAFGRFALVMWICLGVMLAVATLATAATFTVDTAADEGEGSLRAAIEQAIAAGGGGHSIVFNTTVFHGESPVTIDITEALPDLTVELTINATANQLTDRSPGVVIRSVIDGGDGLFASGLVLNADPGVTLRSLRITNFQAEFGGGILILGGSNNLENLVLEDNRASVGGGAFIEGGTNTFTQTSINGNNVTSQGGGVYLAAGTNTFTDTTIDSNTVEAPLIFPDIITSGGGVYIADGFNNFTRTSISDNTDLAASGGGLHVQGGTNTFTHATIDRNTAGGSGGGAYIVAGINTFIDSTLDTNAAEEDGGGAYILAGINSFASSTFNHNNATFSGGGIYLIGGTNTFTDSNLNHNNATFGSGGGASIVGGTNIFTDGSISENTAGALGGGVFDSGGTTSFVRTPIHGNQAGDTADNRNGATIGAVPEFDFPTAGSWSLAGSIPSTTYAIDVYTGDFCEAEAAGARGTLTHLFSFLVITDGDGEIDNSAYLSEVLTGNFIMTSTQMSGTDPVGTGLPSGCADLTGLDELVVNDDGDHGDEDPTDGICGALEEEGTSCTLRAALEIVSRAGSAGTTILFDADIFPSGLHLIEVFSDLPPIIEPDIRIDARAQGSTIRVAAFEGEAPPATGLDIQADGATVIGLHITGFVGNGIQVHADAEGTWLDGIELYGNGGESQGGGIHNAGSHTTITDSFIHNNHGVSGGGLYNSGSGLLVEDSRIEQNTATRGGGAYLAAGTSQFTNSNLNGNNVTSQGGGVYLLAGTNTFTDTSIDANTVAPLILLDEASGGGAFITGGTNTFTRTSISDNTDLFSSGGGLYVQGGTNAFTHATIDRNTAGGSGGGAYLFDGINHFTASTLDHNNATDYGGGAFVEDQGTHTFTNSVLRSNTAGSYGGGIYAAPSITSLHLMATTVTGNTAQLGGGVYFVPGGSMSILESPIHANTAMDVETPGQNRVGDPLGFTPVGNATSATGYSGNLTAAPDSQYRIDVYTASDCEAPAQDRGTVVFLGALNVTTNATGFAEFSVPLSGVPSGTYHAVSTLTSLNDGSPINTGLPSDCVAGTGPPPGGSTGGGGGGGGGFTTSDATTEDVDADEDSVSRADGEGESGDGDGGEGDGGDAGDGTGTSASADETEPVIEIFNQRGDRIGRNDALQGIVSASSAFSGPTTSWHLVGQQETFLRGGPSESGLAPLSFHAFLWDTELHANGAYDLELRDGDRVLTSRTVVIDNPTITPGDLAVVTLVAVAVIALATGLAQAISMALGMAAQEAGIAVTEDRMRTRLGGRERVWRRPILYSTISGASALALLAFAFSTEGLSTLWSSEYLQQLRIIGIAAVFIFAFAYLLEIILSLRAGLQVGIRFLLPGFLSLVLSSLLFRFPVGYPAYIADRAKPGNAELANHWDALRNIAIVLTPMMLMVPLVLLRPRNYAFTDAAIEILAIEIMVASLPFAPLPGAGVWRHRKSWSLALMLGTLVIFALVLVGNPAGNILIGLGVGAIVLFFLAQAIMARHAHRPGPSIWDRVLDVHAPGPLSRVATATSRGVDQAVAAVLTGTARAAQPLAVAAHRIQTQARPRRHDLNAGSPASLDPGPTTKTTGPGADDEGLRPQ